LEENLSAGTEKIFGLVKKNLSSHKANLSSWK
jgi:hypothetical protein